MTHILLTGDAGTGKTTHAIREALKSSKPVVIIRAVIDSGRGIGYLPGDVDEKINPWFDFYKDIFEYVEKGAMKRLLSKHMLNFLPTTFLRGRTFVEHEVILDEFQNLTFKELSTVVTRIGLGSRLIVCGDPNQSDLPQWARKDVRKFVEIFASLPHVKRMHLEENHRAGLVAHYLEEVRRYEHEYETY